jgi:hypothetical protein
MPSLRQQVGQGSSRATQASLVDVCVPTSGKIAADSAESAATGRENRHALVTDKRRMKPRINSITRGLPTAA